MAVTSVVHRDVKPDNFVFDSDGHIRICDFGLAQDFHWSHDADFYSTMRRLKVKDTAEANSSKGIQIDVISKETSTAFDPPTEERILEWRSKNRKRESYSIVGTNNYMACEVLLGTGYDKSADWWSLGVIIFEMLFGFPPFCSKNARQTQIKIVNWKQTLQFPDQPKVSSEAKDLIKKLICDKETRLGRASTQTPQRGFKSPGDADDIKRHPWFKGVDWDLLSVSQPPFVPAIKDALDTTNFETVDEARVMKEIQPLKGQENNPDEVAELRKKLAFVGFTYRAPPRPKTSNGKTNSSFNFE